MVVIEAFAHGVPVIASRIGALAELVKDGETGLLFEPGDLQELSKKVCWAWDHPVEMQQMGVRARKIFEQQYTPERNYAMLISIYQDAMRDAQNQIPDHQHSA
jgi:glycosyltransferase involved in cell wall biosynthesis